MRNHNDEPHMVAIAKWWSPYWEVMSISHSDAEDIMLGNQLFVVSDYYFPTIMAIRAKLLSSSEMLIDINQKGK